MEEPILIVDDEEQIRTTLRGVLQDEGFRTLEADSGEGVVALVAKWHPRLVLLDIWMPQVDGIALLEQLQARDPDLPIIVISGHGTIETAVRATRLGAADFLEKPFSLETLLRSVHRALGKEPGHTTSAQIAAAAADFPALDPTRKISARTIRQSVVAHGRGLHSGVRTGIILHPLSPGSGIVFGTLSSDIMIPATVEYVQSTGYATSLYREGTGVKTVEHLLSALHGYGITNLLIKMQGEVPILDGSALEFCQLLESAGIVEQAEEVEALGVDRMYQIGDRSTGKFLRIEPSEQLDISYCLEYPEPVGRQEFHYVHGDTDSYRETIAPARTFGFLKEIEALEEMGLANGGRLNNCLVIGERGIINPPLRFADELVRHKILDLLGDLYLLGQPLRGKVTACRQYCFAACNSRRAASTCARASVKGTRGSPVTHYGVTRSNILGNGIDSRT